jgi:hypothetical protein
MPSAGESSLLFAVSSWTVGSGVIPEHSRNSGRYYLVGEINKANRDGTRRV